MERLKQSLAQLTTPICNSCGIEMAWSRSSLIAEERSILHVFVCTRCGAISDSKTPVKASDE
jgi:hypothetical protein